MTNSFEKYFVKLMLEIFNTKVAYTYRVVNINEPYSEPNTWRH